MLFYKEIGRIEEMPKEYVEHYGKFSDFDEWCIYI
jgi:hypothetical protein